MKDLDKLLREHNMYLPRHGFFQFDNCSENKVSKIFSSPRHLDARFCSQNKYLFGYLSKLIESEELEVAEICFLVVGHTHCSVDRFFSTISNAVTAAQFIPTPMALRALLATFDRNESKRPKIVRMLEVGVFPDIY